MNEKQTAHFRQDHSLRYLEMALRTDRQEIVENPDGYGKQTGECGDTVEFYLMVHRGRLQLVSFYIHGCINTNACCNALVKMLEGQTVDAAWEVTPETVISYLETLPRDHHHCAELSVGAFYLALSNYLERKRQGLRFTMKPGLKR